MATIQFSAYYTVEPWHENAFQKKSEFLSVCPTSQFYPSYITKQKTGWQPFTWVTSRVLKKQVMLQAGTFPFNSDGSGLEYCSIAESNEFYIFSIYCSNCKKTFQQREHLQNHIQSLHEESFNDRGTTNGDESQTIINAVTCQCKCAGFVDNPQFKRKSVSDKFLGTKTKLRMKFQGKTNCYQT